MSVGDWISIATFVLMLIGGVAVVVRKDAALQSLIESMSEFKKQFAQLQKTLDRIDNDLIRKDEVIAQLRTQMADHEARIRVLEQQG